MTSRQENWGFVKALLFASPYAVWMLCAAPSNLSTAGGMTVVMGAVSAFTAGLLVCNVIVREWRPWQRYGAALGLVVLTLFFGYLVTTAEWLRYSTG